MKRLSSNILSAAVAALALVLFAGCDSKKNDTAKARKQMLEHYIQTNEIRNAKTQIKMFDDALEQYRLDIGEYPESLEDLVKNNSDNEKWQGPYLKPASISKDPWGHEYEYTKRNDEDGREYEIVCFGPDGRKGTEDDITNFDGENEK